MKIVQIFYIFFKLYENLCKSFFEFYNFFTNFRDQTGLTPFMYAVNNRIYGAAVLLWDTAHRLTRSTPQYKECFTSMIFPPGSNLDNSPLFLLCYNDTCSFTWTGDEHINQVN